jgi:hypothetical protein
MTGDSHKVTVQSADPDTDFEGLEAALTEADLDAKLTVKSTHAVVEVAAADANSGASGACFIAPRCPHHGFGRLRRNLQGNRPAEGCRCPLRRALDEAARTASVTPEWQLKVLSRHLALTRSRPALTNA